MYLASRLLQWLRARDLAPLLPLCTAARHIDVTLCVKGVEKLVTLCVEGVEKLVTRDLHTSFAPPIHTSRKQAKRPRIGNLENILIRLFSNIPSVLTKEEQSSPTSRRCPRQGIERAVVLRAAVVAMPKGIDRQQHCSVP